jgi:hypothetical protein
MHAAGRWSTEEDGVDDLMLSLFTSFVLSPSPIFPMRVLYPVSCT